MVLSRRYRAALAFQEGSPHANRRRDGSGTPRRGSGRPPEPSWRDRLGRLLSWALAAAATRLLALAAMLARHGVVSRRQWRRLSSASHGLQRAALVVLRKVR
ncbi:hypothetical protein [uncultured Sphingomonas sp.]|uniref:hypothetical protein n=1 Tax=uncultured Sphingomonas sp. TaxID=158754 RepID=UPI0026210658|nr:hypothetical protein [uncultured Sphingomonas sp.]